MAVDWSTEWFTSIVWILGVTIAAAVGAALVGWLLARSTVWGRQFRRLAVPVLLAARPARAGGRCSPPCCVLLLTIARRAAQRAALLLNNGLFTALQQLDAGGVRPLSRHLRGPRRRSPWRQALLAFYVQQRLVIRWRVWLNDHIVDDWLDGAAYHRGRFTRAPVDNPDQRIQEDIATFPATLGDPGRRRGQRRWCRWCRSRSSSGSCPGR